MDIESEDENNNESVTEWFSEEAVGYVEKGIVIYPTLQSFRQPYTKYVKDQLAKEEHQDDNSNNKVKEQSKPRIILITTFYETADSVKYHLNV